MAGLFFFMVGVRLSGLQGGLRGLDLGIVSLAALLLESSVPNNVYKPTNF